MNSVQWLLARVTWQAALDIGLVTLCLYWLLSLVEGTRADRILRGILVIGVAASLLGFVFRLPTVGWLIDKAIPALLVAIPVIFQPELRRALEQVGRSSRVLARPMMALGLTGRQQVAAEIAHACTLLQQRHFGALIIIERSTGLEDYAATGVRLDAAVSAELLVTIFHTKSALHDGAVIIRGDRVLTAGCVLPLSESTEEMGRGTRHRAALGISEQTDALAIVVSEETGRISIAEGGRLDGGLRADDVRIALGGRTPRERHPSLVTTREHHGATAPLLHPPAGEPSPEPEPEEPPADDIMPSVTDSERRVISPRGEGRR